MSKSYFERRIFGQDGQSESVPRQAPTLGTLKSAGHTLPTNGATPSQPYRFRGGRDETPAISAPARTLSPQPPQGWAASDELRNRLRTAHAQPEPQPQWQAETAQPAQVSGYDEPQAYQDGPYPLEAPQPPLANAEPSFGFHASEEFEHDQFEDEQRILRAATVATTATHAEHQGAAPKAAVTEPRVASASGVRVGERVNLSDQRSGASVHPNLYVSSDDRIGGGAAQQAGPRAGNPLAGGGRKPAGKKRVQSNQNRHAMRASALAGGRRPAPRRRDDDGGNGIFGFFRNGALALALLFGAGVVMSVSYAALQGFRNDQTADIPVLMAPEGPAKLRPDEAGISPAVAAGRAFEGDLTVLSNPMGVLEPSDDRFAADSQDSPTMTMNFGGQSLIIPQIDSAQPAIVTDPMANIIAASSGIDPLNQPSVLTPLTQSAGTATLVQPQPEEPLADLSPLANGLRDLPLPNRRARVPASYQGIVTKVQQSTTTTTTTSTGLSSAGTETALVAGQRGTTATIDPAAGMPTTPQSNGLTGAAVVSPFGIQLASLRTEQQANVLWKRLQAKYPGQLGGLSSRVVRFDSGARGVFYRLQAGPMPSKATALDQCIKLKTAGQECIFVRG